MNNNYDKNNKPQNFEINVPLIDVTVYKKPYDSSEQIMNIIENVSWPLIDIPVYCSRSIVMNDSSAKGNTVIGYVKDYDVEKKVFTVIIYHKFGETVSELEDVVLFPKTTKMEDEVRISNMLIGPTSSFEYITKIPVNNNRNFRNRRQF